MHLVHLALVPEEAARVGESRVEFAPSFATLVRTLLPVHVLVPFAHSLEGLILPVAINMVAVHLIVFVARTRKRETNR